MKADNFRLGLSDGIAFFQIEGTLNARNSRISDAELGIVGSQPLPPRCLDGIVLLRQGVTEKIEVKRFADARANLRHVVADLAWRRPGSRKRAQPARFGNRDRHIDADVASHWRLDDGMLNFA